MTLERLKVLELLTIGQDKEALATSLDALRCQLVASTLQADNLTNVCPVVDPIRVKLWEMQEELSGYIKHLRSNTTVLPAN